MTQLADERARNLPAIDRRPGLRVGLVGAYMAISIVALAFGALKLVLLPFDGDQSIFVMAGETIASGGLLYVDYWDVKQPGIYLFFAAAGSLFGFTNWGVHLFELAYWAAVSVAVAWLMRPLLANAWLASSVPLLFLATYFGHAGRWHATQVEILAAGPLAIAIALICRALMAGQRSGLLYLGAGVCAGVTLIFKLPLAPVYLALFAFIWVHLWFAQGVRDLSAYVASCLWVCAGVALPLVPLFVWLGAQGLIGELWYVTVQYPREVIADGIPSEAGYLRAAAGVWFTLSALAGLCVAIGLYLWLDRGERPLLFTLSLVATLGVSMSIAIQIYSLWEYHFQLFYMPVAIMFVVAIDRFLEVARMRAADAGLARFAAVAVMGSLVASQVMASDWRPAYKFTRDVLVRGETYDSFLADSSKAMAELDLIASVVEVEPGTPIYVFGDPKLYRMMKVPQAVPVPGWYWELAPQSLFDRTADDLWQAQPAYVFMIDYYAEMVFSAAPAIQRLLDERYEVVAELPQGRWYALRTGMAR